MDQVGQCAYGTEGIHLKSATKNPLVSEPRHSQSMSTSNELTLLLWIFFKNRAAN